MSLTPMEAFLLGVRWREDIHTHDKRVSTPRIIKAFRSFDQHPGVFRGPDEDPAVIGSIVPLPDGVVVRT